MVVGERTAAKAACYVCKASLRRLWDAIACSPISIQGEGEQLKLAAYAR